MESFFTFLERRVDDSSSLLCVGLDPHIPDLKEPTAASARDFCLNLIKQTARYAAAFKPNAAFFEVFGAEGWTALKQVIDAIKEESVRLGSKIPMCSMLNAETLQPQRMRMPNLHLKTWVRIVLP